MPDQVRHDGLGLIVVAGQERRGELGRGAVVVVALGAVLAAAPVSASLYAAFRTSFPASANFACRLGAENSNPFGQASAPASMNARAK